MNLQQQQQNASSYENSRYKRDMDKRLANGLGWFSVGLGVASEEPPLPELPAGAAEPPPAPALPLLALPPVPAEPVGWLGFVVCMGELSLLSEQAAAANRRVTVGTKRGKCMETSLRVPPR